MLISQVLLNSFSLLVPFTIIIAIVFIRCIMGNYGWNNYVGRDDDKSALVPVLVLEVDKHHKVIKKLIYASDSEYTNKPNFRWKWLAEARRMGWEQEPLPPEVSLIYNKSMLKEANKILKIAPQKENNITK